ncbi:MAG: chromate transporter [Clostridia bacterium]|nr:chromate transporter [Clostridia bacterium]
MKLLFDLFVIFARIGGFTFGGGYAMLPMLQKEVVEKRKWATQDELMDYYAIGQCTPGIIAVNVATFIGTKLRGFWGALFATLGVITPSIIIIMIIAAFISGFQDIEIVTHAFNGIRAAVVALILSSVIKLSKKSIVDKITVVIFVLVAILSFFTDISPVVFIIAVAFISLAVNMIKEKKMKGGKEK